MGMFDSLYAERGGTEWQTKAFGCNLDVFVVGDQMPDDYNVEDYQVEVLGDGRPKGGDEFADSLATVVEGVLVAVDVPRDERLPLVDYSGGVRAGNEGTDMCTEWTCPRHGAVNRERARLAALYSGVK